MDGSTYKPADEDIASLYNHYQLGGAGNRGGTQFNRLFRKERDDRPVWDDIVTSGIDRYDWVGSPVPFWTESVADDKNTIHEAELAEMKRLREEKRWPGRTLAKYLYGFESTSPVEVGFDGPEDQPGYVPPEEPDDRTIEERVDDLEGRVSHIEDELEFDNPHEP